MIDVFIGYDEGEKIRNEIEAAGQVKGLTALKEKVDPGFTYMELKMVLMAMER